MASKLPIESIRAELSQSLANNRRFILSAPAGSGKSTQVPQFLIDDGTTLLNGEIWVLQPRRLPARMLAHRVARERGESAGQTVGYMVRFDAKRSAHSKILFVTEALLLRRLQQSPDLKGIGAVLFDEFHERHLDGDLALALCRRVQDERRPDLILGVMSATLEIDVAAAFLPGSTILRTDARTFPVDIQYLAAGELPVWEAAAKAFKKAAANEIGGDYLIFMPGAYEIRKTLESLSHLRECKGWDMFPLHGQLPLEAQDAAVSRGDRPRIIVSTNVAETSLTIEGVRLVIDSGQARVPNYDPNRGINTLLVESISQASADQRAGRAGRVAAGVCYRLWSEKDHWRRPAHTEAESLRLELSEALLTLADLGIGNFAQFEWLQPPPTQHLERAIELLTDLGALEPDASAPNGDEFQITATGRKMAGFPLHPRYARIILAGSEFGCIGPLCLAVALCQARDLLLPLSDKGKARKREELLLDEEAAKSDVIFAMRAWQWARRESFAMGFCREWGIHRAAAAEAGQVAAQLMEAARSAGLNTEDQPVAAATLRRCLLQGFSDHLAIRRNRSTLVCDLVHRRRGEIRRHSVVQDDTILFSSQIEEREQRGDVVVLLGQNTAVDLQWLKEDFPGAFQERRETRFEEGSRRIIQSRNVQFRDLVLESTETGTPDPDAAARLLAEGVTQGQFVLKSWNESVENWIRRVNCLVKHFPEWELSPISDSDRQFLIEQICYGAISYKEIKDRPVMPVLEEWLNPAERPLVNRYAPERFSLPSGNSVKLRYEADGSVILSAVLQQLYDVPGKQLKIGDGRIPLKIELLAPSRRPVQITADLDAFWQSSYPAVKKDLKGRYPKHEWR